MEKEQQQNKVYRNVTRIIFNDKLKTFICWIRNNYPNLLESNDWEVIKKDQQELRGLLIEYQHHIDTNGFIPNNSSNMPDCFAFICSCICDLDSVNTWADVWDQHRERYYDASACCLKNNEWFEFGNEMDSSSKQFKCCCGQSCFVDSCTMLTNYSLNKSMIIAQICIEKTGIINRKEFNQCKPTHYIKNHEKRLAKSRNTKDKTDLFIDMVQKMYTKSKNNRKCIDCKKYDIPINKPSFAIRCLKCWLKIKYPLKDTKCLLTFRK
jgi:hypothetical protein